MSSRMQRVLRDIKILRFLEEEDDIDISVTYPTFNVQFLICVTLRPFLNIPISLIATIVASLRTLAKCVNAGDKQNLTVFVPST